MELQSVWIVLNPTADSEMGDICFEASVRRGGRGVNLVRYILGTGEFRWDDENSTMYADKASAVRDATQRLKDQGSLKKASPADNYEKSLAKA